MCGRFFFYSDPATVGQQYPQLILPDALVPRYNIAPGQYVAVVPNTDERQLDFFRWGLVPSWAKDEHIGSRLINARLETLAEKPSFRAALRRRRCLILADGFYEWFLEPGATKKTPLAFQRPSGQPFAFAGLWEVWSAPDGSELRTCAIITTAANAFIERFHTRMPVILDPTVFDAWLDPQEQSPARLHAILTAFPADTLVAFPVTTLVNNVRHDSPACIEPTGTSIVAHEVGV